MKIINVRCEILTYHFNFSEDNKVDIYKRILTQKEIGKITSYTRRHMAEIISGPDHTNAADIRLEIPKIQRNIERGIAGENFEERSMSDRSYNKLFYLLRKNYTKESQLNMIDEMRWDNRSEITPEEIDAISDLTKLTIDYCIERFKEDIDNYVLNNKVRTTKKGPLHQRLEILQTISENEEAFKEDDRSTPSPDHSITPSTSTSSPNTSNSSPESKDQKL